MPRSALLRVAATLGFLLLSSPAHAGDRVLRAQLVLEAPVEEVWKAWTTEEGIKSFFAPDCHIDPRVDGDYEIFFAPNRPAGQRGADGMRILALEPQKRFAFTWNAPGNFPFVRTQRTQVVLDFEPLGSQRTRLQFTHQGWGDSPEWDGAYEYFEKAWGTRVLPLLKYRFEKGPVDWAALPKVEPLDPPMRLELAPVKAAASR